MKLQKVYFCTYKVRETRWMKELTAAEFIKAPVIAFPSWKVMKDEMPHYKDMGYRVIYLSERRVRHMYRHYKRNLPARQKKLPL